VEPLKNIGFLFGKLKHAGILGSGIKTTDKTQAYHVGCLSEKGYSPSA
jgi:hypothetical protein